MDGMLAVSHPDIRIEMGERIYRGHAGIREFMDGQTWGVAGHVWPERVFGRDELDATVVVLHFEKRHVSSGEVATARPRSVGSARLRDGLIVHVSAREPSLEAALKGAWVDSCGRAPTRLRGGFLMDLCGHGWPAEAASV